MIDKQKILALVKTNFKTTGRVTVDDQGLVSVTGNCELTQKITKLPVQFDHVVGDFNCTRSQLESLEGAPQSVDGWFSCSYSELESLLGAPQSVGNHFYCYSTTLKSLLGAPRSVGGDFDCLATTLESLAGAPQSVGGKFYCSYDRSLGLLPLLLIKDLKGVSIGNDTVNSILNRYLGQGRDGIIPCAAELHKAGYGSNAKL